MNLESRIGIDLGRKIKLEDGIEWAHQNGVQYVDCELDVAPNALPSFTPERCAVVRDKLKKYGVKLGLHTLSAVNTAEYSPFVSEAVDAYLKAYIDTAKNLSAGWIVIHGGYHFTGDYDVRMKAGLDRINRIADYAERCKIPLLLENLNKEPDDAEVHYIPHNLEECQFFLNQISSPYVRWSFTINHAHLVPEGIVGHVNNLDMRRCGEVRIADNKGDKEEHLQIGEGNINFADVFNLIESSGFTGHYMNAFGSLDDMLLGRNRLARIASAL
jgi:sugar phosphate isomerase/epimerase